MLHFFISVTGFVLKSLFLFFKIDYLSIEIFVAIIHLSLIAFLELIYFHTEGADGVLQLLYFGSLVSDLGFMFVDYDLEFQLEVDLSFLFVGTDVLSFPFF